MRLAMEVTGDPLDSAPLDFFKAALTHAHSPAQPARTMGLLDSLIGSVLSGGDQQNALVKIATSLISNHGSGNGLAGLAQQFDQRGLGHLMQSWISTGENQQISPEQMQDALGREQVAQIAAETGMQQNDVAGGLAALLPQLIDKLTPQGQVPAKGDIQGMLAGLLGSLGK
jgi:uncharacterized protein YidB (DUF937 family)